MRVANLFLHRCIIFGPPVDDTLCRFVSDGAPPPLCGTTTVFFTKLEFEKNELNTRYEYMLLTRSPLKCFVNPHLFLPRLWHGGWRGCRWGVLFNGNQAILTRYSSCSSGLSNNLGWSYKVGSITNYLSCFIPTWRTEASTTQTQTHLLPSALGGSTAGLRSGRSGSLGGGCVWIGVGAGGGGVYLKLLRLFMTWFPTNVLRPKALQSTTVMESGGWRCSFSGNS